MNQRENDPRSQTATGMLIYPTIEQDYDLIYRFRNHKIIIATVNLNTGWKNIESCLLNLITI